MNAKLCLTKILLVRSNSVEFKISYFLKMAFKGPAIIDVTEFLRDKSSPNALEACKRAAETLKSTSCLIIKDPRVTEDHNNTFLSMMEKYYELPTEKKMKDVRQEMSYQLGATPEFIEVPRDHTEVIKSLKPENAAHVPSVISKLIADIYFNTYILIPLRVLILNGGSFGVLESDHPLQNILN